MGFTARWSLFLLYINFSPKRRFIKVLLSSVFDNSQTDLGHIYILFAWTKQSLSSLLDSSVFFVISSFILSLSILYNYRSLSNSSTSSILFVANIVIRTLFIFSFIFSNVFYLSSVNWFLNFCLSFHNFLIPWSIRLSKFSPI